MRICFFGDSFVSGFGDDECLGWVGRASAYEQSRKRDLTVYNLGVRRDTSTDILARWKSEARARLPNECDPRFVFAFGTNDTSDRGDGAPRVSLSDTLNHTRAILTEAIAWAPTLMIGPAPFMESVERNNRIVQLSTALSEVCSSLGAPMLSLASAPAGVVSVWREDARAGDGVHPNARGYSALARLILQWPPWRSWFDA